MVEFVSKIGEATDSFMGMTDEVKKLGKEFESENFQKFMKGIDTSAKALKELQQFQSRARAASAGKDIGLASGLSFGDFLSSPTSATTIMVGNLVAANSAGEEFLRNQKNAEQTQEKLTELTEKEAKAREEAAKAAFAQWKALFDAQEKFGERALKLFVERNQLDPAKASEAWESVAIAMDHAGDAITKFGPSLASFAVEPMTQVIKAHPSVRTALTDLTLGFMDIANSGQEVGQRLSSAFAEATVQLRGLREITVSFLQDIARMWMQMATNRLFSGLFSNILGGLAGWLGGFHAVGSVPGLITDIGPAPNLPLTLPGFADGGSYGPGARIVGENGPELQIDGRSGYVIPNNMLRQLGGGGGTIVYNIDARGAAPGVERDIMRALQATENRAVVRSVRTMEERQKRR
jgi:hypothetical protein